MNTGGSVVIKEFLVALGFQDSSAQLRRFAGGVAGATATVGLLGVAVSMAATAISAFIQTAASDLNQLSDFSKRVGVAADEVARLGYVAKLTDSSVEDVQGALESLSNAAGQVAVGGGPKQTFDLLRISVRGANGELKGAGRLLNEVGDRIRKLPRAQQLAMLGNLGINRNMLRMLTEDVSGLRAEFDQIYAAAGVGLNEAAQRGSDYMDSVNRLRFTLEGFWRAISLRLMGRIGESMDKFRRFLLDNMQAILDGLEPAIAAILRYGEGFIILIGRIISWFSKMNAATDGWLGWVAAAVAAWRLLNLSFIATPIGAIITGVLLLGAAIAALIDDFQTWKEGGESLIDWEKWGPVLGAATARLRAFGQMIAWVFSTASHSIGAFVDLITGDFTSALESLNKVFEPIIEFFKQTWDYISKITGVGQAFAALAGLFGGGEEDSGPFFPEGFWEPKPPSPAAQAALGGTSMQQKTEINVNGAADPRATAEAVAGLQGQVNNQMVRNFRGAVR